MKDVVEISLDENRKCFFDKITHKFYVWNNGRKICDRSKENLIIKLKKKIKK